MGQPHDVCCRVLQVEDLTFRANDPLLLTHGVGPVRKYSIGAVLLDTKDPPPRYSPARAVVEHLDLNSAVHIGHSTGGGEATHYVAQYGQRRGHVAKLVLIGAVPPIVVKNSTQSRRPADGVVRWPAQGARRRRG